MIYNLKNEIDPDDNQIRANEPKEFYDKKLYQYIFVIPPGGVEKYLKLEA
jgi:hypothetical protein